MLQKYSPLVLKVVAAFIMLQTLFFKFSGAQESIDLFTKLAGNNEAFLRIGTGALEFITAILLFVPKKTWLGALLGVGIMSGAILSHITILGISHNNDGGALFVSAIITFVASFILLILNRNDILFISSK